MAGVERSSQHRRAVPLHLICGFLGAGKTTLLRRLLALQPARESLAVLVNEFGRLGIDGELLAGFKSQVRELRAGCICCEMRLDFIRTLTEVLESFHPERVMVEATGVADAKEMIKTVEEMAGKGLVALSSVVSVVSADVFDMREVFGSFYLNQIRSGDLVLLNKTDLIDPGQVESMSAQLAEINPRARLLPVVHCAVEREMAIHPGTDGRAMRDATGLENLIEIGLLPQGPEHRPGEGDDFVSFFFESEEALGRACLEGFLAGLPWQMFRVKGFVRTEEGPYVINYTYRRPQWEPHEFSGPSRLAFVGWRLDPAEYLHRLEPCKVGAP